MHRIACITLLLTLIAGCTIQSHSGDGKSGDNVKIATPFGGMSVKADQTSASDIGLPTYPGATPERDNNDQSANVSMNFGSFRLKVLAASYKSNDAPAKVLAFYRPELAKYGDVLECDHHHAVGAKAVTSSGLTCDTNQHGRTTDVHTRADDGGARELRAGQPHNFRIVTVEPEGSGTKLGLVYFELPHDSDKGNVD